MKLFGLVCALVISYSTFAQTTVEKEVGDFSEIKVFDLIEVNLIASETNKVVIKGDNTQSVKIINEDGTLKLRMELEERFDGNKTFVEVFYKNIKIIDANEGAKIVANEAIQQNNIELRAQEGAMIRVGLQVNYTKIKAVSGGIVEATGLATKQEIKLNTGGIFKGPDLKTKDTDVRITAAGEAEIHATDKATIRITAGGKVTVYGNPRELDERKFAGGKIIEVIE